MDIVTVRFQEEILKRMDENIAEHNYNSRTEFIREAIRDKLEMIRRENLIDEFMKYRGKAKKKTTYEENRRTKEIVGKELMEKLDKRFS